MFYYCSFCHIVYYFPLEKSPVCRFDERELVRIVFADRDGNPLEVEMSGRLERQP